MELNSYRVVNILVTNEEFTQLNDDILNLMKRFADTGGNLTLGEHFALTAMRGAINPAHTYGTFGGLDQGNIDSLNAFFEKYKNEVLDTDTYPVLGEIGRSLRSI